MHPSPMIYHPKGGMCCVCRDLKKDCSALPFETMPVISHGDTFKIVKCTQFERVTVPTTERKA